MNFIIIGVDTFGISPIRSVLMVEQTMIKDKNIYIILVQIGSELSQRRGRVFLVIRGGTQRQSY